MHHLLLQVTKPGSVGLLPRPEEDVHGKSSSTEPGQHPGAAQLSESALQPVPVHDAVAVLRDDEAEARTRNGGQAKKDVEMGRLRSLPPPQNLSDIACLVKTAGLRKPKLAARTRALAIRPRDRSIHEPYFEPVETVRRRRPRARRRFSVFLPPFVAIRARKPCLLARLRLRGRYVGFMVGARPS